MPASRPKIAIHLVSRPALLRRHGNHAQTRRANNFVKLQRYHRIARPAAYFIEEFAGDTPGVHLDIAGTAWLDEPKPHMAKDSSRVCFRTFTNLAMNW